MAAMSNDRLDRLLVDLEGWKEELKSGGYGLAAQLLAMTIMELRISFHGISDDEFKAFCCVLAKSQPHCDTVDKKPLLFKVKG